MARSQETEDALARNNTGLNMRDRYGLESIPDLGPYRQALEGVIPGAQGLDRLDPNDASRNADILAVYSELVYHDQQVVDVFLKEMGLDGRYEAKLLQGTRDTQALVVFYKGDTPEQDATIIAFRGTESLRDVLTDVNSVWKDTEKGVSVHLGFYTALHGAKDDVLPSISELIEKHVQADQAVRETQGLPPRAQYVTGHSLGGALAGVYTLDQVEQQVRRETLFMGIQPAYAFPGLGFSVDAGIDVKKINPNKVPVKQLVTFGAPASMEGIGADIVDAGLTRDGELHALAYMNNNDMVPYLAHFAFLSIPGTHVQIDGNGVLHENLPWIERAAMAAARSAYNGWQHVKGMVTEADSQGVLTYAADHSMSRYRTYALVNEALDDVSRQLAAELRLPDGLVLADDEIRGQLQDATNTQVDNVIAQARAELQASGMIASAGGHNDGPSATPYALNAVDAITNNLFR